MDLADQGIPPMSGRKGGVQPGAGRPRLAHGRTRRIEITLGEDECKTLDAIAEARKLGSTQAAIRWLIAKEQKAPMHWTGKIQKWRPREQEKGGL